MAFVKLDCGILDSTLWVSRDPRELFITALLMATPFEVMESLQAIQVESLDYSGFIVPPGWYGFVAASGPGIVRRAGVPHAEGMKALAMLGDPDKESRSEAWEGRRMVRVDGGYIILNYMKYREKDEGSAARSKRYRDRKALQLAQQAAGESRVTATPTRVTRHVSSLSEAEAEAEAEEKKEGVPSKKKTARKRPEELAAPSDVSLAVWSDWLKVRKQKGAAVTDTAIAGIRREACSAGLTLQQALEMCCQRGWSGFMAKWLANDASPSRPVRPGDMTPEQDAARRAKRDAEAMRLLGFDRDTDYVIEG